MDLDDNYTVLRKLMTWIYKKVPVSGKIDNLVKPKALPVFYLCM